MIHIYRWRLGLAMGDPKYDDLEQRLAAGPVITVASIALDGGSNGVAPPTDGSSYRKKFTGKYSHQIVKGNARHNLPQEATQASAEAMVEVDGY